jgi:REP element-mobilizing transposase RayT
MVDAGHGLALSVDDAKGLPSSHLVRLRWTLPLFCTADRHPAFSGSGVVDETFSEIMRASNKCQFEIPAYCFMPDHLDLLAEGTEATADLRRVAKRR